MAELISLWSRSELEKTEPGLAGQIAAYRAGYLPEERRELEDALKKGRLRGITSTNALELGIDIGSLDAVIIAGYPGTAISTWQQAGRGGRGAGDSVAALVAYEDALDQYFARNPAAFFGRPHEHAVIDLENSHIRAGHLMCAAAEIPVDPEKDRDFFGGDALETQAVLESLGRHGLVTPTPRGWVYSGKARPTEVVSLEGPASEIFTLVCDGRTLGTMDRSQAYREAHEGAVLVHQGETYIIERLDLEDKTAFAKKTDVDYYTVPLKDASLRVTGVLRSGSGGSTPVRGGIGGNGTLHRLQGRPPGQDPRGEEAQPAPPGIQHCRGVVYRCGRDRGGNPQIGDGFRGRPPWRGARHDLGRPVPGPVRPPGPGRTFYTFSPGHRETHNIPL